MTEAKPKAGKSCSSFSWLSNDFLKIPLGMWIIFFELLIGLLVVLLVIFVQPGAKDEVTKIITKDKAEVECVRITRKDKSFCIFSPFKDDEENPPFLEEIPVPYVVISQTGGGQCFQFEACLEATWLYIDKGPTRETSACNFLMGSQGDLFEDRGWNHTNSLKGPTEGRSILLCLIGDYGPWDMPIYPQVEAMKAFIDYGIANGYIMKNYSLVPAKDISDPDRLSGIFKVLKKWPSFNSILSNETIFAVSKQNTTLDIIYTKEDWGGKPEKSHIEIKLPVPYVVISHSVTGQCYSLSECSTLIRNMQSYHLSHNFADLAYNFLVDSGGNVYQARGWTKRNTLGGFVNGRSIEINFIGDYSQDIKPTEKQLNAAKALIQLGVETEKISKNYSLLAANSTHATLSPGKNVYAEIKKWPHFDPEPKLHLKEYEED